MEDTIVTLNVTTEYPHSVPINASDGCPKIDKKPLHTLLCVIIDNPFITQHITMEFYVPRRGQIHAVGLPQNCWGTRLSQRASQYSVSGMRRRNLQIVTPRDTRLSHMEYHCNILVQ